MEYFFEIRIENYLIFLIILMILTIVLYNDYSFKFDCLFANETLLNSIYIFYNPEFFTSIDTAKENQNHNLHKATYIRAK